MLLAEIALDAKYMLLSLTVARLAREHPLIRRKLEFVMAVYARIDPRMAAVFRELGVQ
jgi:hypothetical protein